MDGTEDEKKDDSFEIKQENDADSESSDKRTTREAAKSARDAAAKVKLQL
jgi:hypothetical protein